MANHFDLRAVARPVLEELATSCGETVHLGMLEDTHVRYLDCIESPALLRVGGRVGLRTPAYASSLGKAMLATLSDDAVRALFPEEDLPAVTARTVTTRSALLAELRRVRERGYAQNREEVEPGVASVAMAVPASARGVVAAMSVAAPVSRSSADRVRDHADFLTRATSRLADLL
ncbi:IclR family transcriptional regulator [Georgenia sp. AZ-5]|uniref:IclR family transcriptional regulator n=1 Tax=Georgenia sp. AZ-5 TaxID=3367526 RepID=UPI0037553647